MIVLGYYKKHMMTVNQSNVEPELVTYQLFKKGKNVGMSREDCIYEADHWDDFFEEAAKRYKALGRPNLEEWDGDKLRELGIWTEPEQESEEDDE